MGQITAAEKNEFSSIYNPLTTHDKIIDLLKKNKYGLTVAEISRRLKTTRNTISISIARLEGAGKVDVKKVGMAKIYSLKPEVQIKLEVDNK